MKRKYARKELHLKAKIALNDRTCDGSIEDVSEGGMGYLITSSFQASEEIVPGKLVNLTFQTPEGVSIHLQCEIMWSTNKLFHDDALTIGLKIIEPTPLYLEWIKSMHIDSTTI